MNLYAAALIAKKDGVATVSPLLFRANNRDEFSEAANVHCEELYPRSDGYYDLEFAGNEYALPEVLEDIKRALTVDGVPTKEQHFDNSLALATLCDMVLGENAEDRSNTARAQAANREQKEKLLGILAEKQDAQLRDLSPEELQGMIANL